MNIQETAKRFNEIPAPVEYYNPCEKTILRARKVMFYKEMFKAGLTISYVTSGAPVWKNN